MDEKVKLVGVTRVYFSREEMSELLEIVKRLESGDAISFALSAKVRKAWGRILRESYRVE